MTVAAERIRPVTVLRAHGWWIVATIVLVMLGAYAYTKLSTPVYTSQSTIVLQTVVTQNTTPVAPAMGTEKQVATSGIVLDRASRALGVSAEDLKGRVEVSVPPEANVLTIQCTAVDGPEAQRCADAVSEAYVAYRNASGSRETPPTLEASVVTTASLPQSPSGHSLAFVMLLALSSGAALGVVIAFAKDLASDKVRSRSDLVSISNLTVLGELPRMRRVRIPGGRRPTPPHESVRLAPMSGSAEAFRFLRARVEATAGGDLRRKVILVTSPRDGAGRSTTAVNLAAAIAATGRFVALVDADFDDPSLQAKLWAPDPRGLTDVLAGRVNLTTALQQSGVPGVLLLPAGQGRAYAIDEMRGSLIEPLFTLLTDADYTVVVDGGATLGRSETLTFATVSDLVLLVASARTTTREDVLRAVRDLESVGTPSIAAVVNDVPRVLLEAQASSRHFDAGPLVQVDPPDARQMESSSHDEYEASDHRAEGSDRKRPLPRGADGQPLCPQDDARSGESWTDVARSGLDLPPDGHTSAVVDDHGGAEASKRPVPPN